MTRKRAVLTSTLVFVIGTAWFCFTGYQRGRADFEAVSKSEPPHYATHYAYLLDGGTEWFRGRGYSVYRMHRILMGHGNNPPEGYLGGSKIEWKFPLCLFAFNDDLYFYIPDTPN